MIFCVLRALTFDNRDGPVYIFRYRPFPFFDNVPDQKCRRRLFWSPGRHSAYALRAVPS